VGTSAGLFSTTELNGDSTVWVKEGATTIGNVIVDMVDARSTDGFVAVGTHGNGVYSTYYDPALGFEQRMASLQVISVYPNPAREDIWIELSSRQGQTVDIGLYDAEGRLMDILLRERIEPGSKLLQLNLKTLKAGVYYLLFKTVEGNQSRKVVVL
jgi:hypothetical protein